MIKKILFAIAIAFPMCVLAQAPKFGVVNANDVFDALPDKVVAQAKLDTISKGYEAEFSKLRSEFDKKYAEFQAIENDANTPQAIKERRIQDLQEFQQKISQFQATAQQDIQRHQEQLMAPIQQKIQTAIQAVGAENGFTFIFPDVVPVYTGTTVIDVTPMVKTKLGVK